MKIASRRCDAEIHTDHEQVGRDNDTPTIDRSHSEGGCSVPWNPGVGMTLSWASTSLSLLAGSLAPGDVREPKGASEPSQL